MLKIFLNKALVLFALAVSLVFIISSCKKDSDGSPDYNAGTPTAANGIKPDSGSGGTVLTLTGSGLGQMRSVVFSTGNVPAPFQSTLNTETNFVFRVPDTAFGGPQNITFTNSEGKTLVVPFRVLAYPVVSSAFPTDFEEGTLVTLKGSNLDDVSKVVIDGTTETATIISKTRSQMVIAMPLSAVNRGKLRITNVTGVRVPDIEFVNVKKATTVFSDQLDNGFQNWGWGGSYDAAADALITGAKGLKAAFDPSGTWGGMQFGGGAISLAGHKYFTFWAKGADIDKNVQFWLNWGNQKIITIPANKWTYFRYELATAYPGVTNVDNVTFQIHDAGKTIYFDNIMFVK
jgi:hypothetical protein